MLVDDCASLSSVLDVIPVKVLPVVRQWCSGITLAVKEKTWENNFITPYTSLLVLVSASPQICEFQVRRRRYAGA